MQSQRIRPAGHAVRVPPSDAHRTLPRQARWQWPDVRSAHGAHQAHAEARVTALVEGAWTKPAIQSGKIFG